MSRSFDKWLARPTTIRLFRTLLNPAERCASYPRLHLNAVRGFGVTSTAIADKTEDTSWLNIRQTSHAEQVHVVPATDKSAAAKDESAASKHTLTTRPLSPGHDTAWEIDTLADRLRSVAKEEGANGVSKIFNTLCSQAVVIPVTGPSAEKVWEILLKHAEITNTTQRRSPSLRQSIIEYAFKLHTATGQHYPPLYPRIVGQTLKDRPRKREAWLLHYRFRRQGIFSSSDVLALVPFVLQSVLPTNAFRHWTMIHSTSRVAIAPDHVMDRVPPDHTLHDSFRQYLDDTVAAEAKRLTALEDDSDIFDRDNQRITEQSFLGPVADNLKDDKEVLRLDSRTHNTNTRATPETYHKIAPERTEGSRYTSRSLTKAPITRADMNTIVGDVYGIKEKTFSDSFCARMLATRLATPRMSISALRLLGVEHLGSLAVQELARRAQSLEELKQLLEEVQRQGIELVENTYTKLLQQLVDEGDRAIFETLLQSDQHPDNFDDFSLQGKLVHEHCRRQLWPEVQLGLKVLALGGKKDPVTTWNALLQDNIIKKLLTRTKHTLRDMKLNGIKITSLSRFVAQSFLAPRNPAKEPQQRIYPTAFEKPARDIITQICKQSLEDGSYVELQLWKEIIKRYGMAWQFHKLHKLVAWINERYRDNAKARERKYRLPDYDTLMNPNLISALVVWSWRAAGRLGKCARDRDGRPEWADGLALLHECQALGMPIPLAVVRKAVKQQLWLLFGPGYSKRKVNDLFVSKNRISLWTYLTQLNEIWPGLIDIRRAIPSSQDAQTKALVALFGITRKTSADKYSTIDVAAWADELEGQPRPMSAYSRLRKRRQAYSRRASIA